MKRPRRLQLAALRRGTSPPDPWGGSYRAVLDRTHAPR